MSNHAEKTAARAYAAEHGVSYQSAINALRKDRALPEVGFRRGQEPLDVQVNLCEKQADGSWLYGEYISEHWLERSSAHWRITLPLIDAIPGLRASLTARLRDEVPGVYAEMLDIYGTEGMADIGSPPHPEALTDQELLTRWLSADSLDEVYGDDDLLTPLGNPDSYTEPMTLDYADPFRARVVEAFPGIEFGDNPSLAATVVIPSGVAFDQQVLHERLIEGVPEWGRLLRLLGPWRACPSPEVAAAQAGH